MSQATLWESCLPVSAAGLNVRHSECLKLNAEGKPVTPFACRPHLPHQPFRMHQDKGACVCVWSQAAEGGNRPVGGGMGVGISLSDWPLSPPLERRSCLAAPLWTPLCACCHVSPCPRGCVPHSDLSLSICLCPHSPFALCFAFCPFLPFLVGALLLPYAPSLPLPSFCLCPALLLPCASLPQPFCLSASVGVLVLSSSGRRAQDKEHVYMLIPILPVICAPLSLSGIVIIPLLPSVLSPHLSA